jgi:ligand-binding sensor domain-containing protein
MRIKIIIASLICYIISYVNVDAQWKDISKRFPSHVRVYQIIQNENTLFAGTNDGVYKSTNSGFSWNVIDKKGWKRITPSHAVSLIALCVLAHNNKLYVGTNGCGLFIYDSNGWRCVSAGMKDYGVNAGDKSPIMALGANREHIFIGSEDGLYSMSENDSSVSESDLGLSIHDVKSMIVSNDSIFVGCQNTSRIGGVTMSTDNGNNWHCIDSTLENHFVLSVNRIGKRILIGTAGEQSALYQSGDNGHSWFKLVSNSDYSFFNVQTIVVQGDKILAGVIGGLLFSKDAGAKWTYIQHPSKRNKSFNLESLVVTEKNIIASTPYEIWSYPISTMAP